ncbi:hypothetical protein SLS60_005978 [Paraconiothyrium brasiliense]|uniref:Uncharacterized protein n=1 Tax=Paraconiothyrium brasiliense TaxID=300254 RepID=A0ABR3RFB6_9PLEO
MSTDRPGPLPPGQEPRNQELLSLETSARPLHFSCVNSILLSDAPSSLLQDGTPDFSIPIPATASYYLTTYVPTQPLYWAGLPTQADRGAPVVAGSLLAPKLEPIAEPGIPPHAMVKPEKFSQMRSPNPEDPPASQDFNPEEVFDRDPSPEVNLEECT